MQMSLDQQWDPALSALAPEKMLLTKNAEDTWRIFPVLVREQGELEESIGNINRLAKSKGLIVLTIILNDAISVWPASEQLLLFRTSLLRSKRQPNEWPLPYLWESKNDPFIACNSADHPSISFCGMSNAHRVPLLDAFEKAEGIRQAFIIREQFWGGKPHDPMLMEEFWNNMLAHPFALAPRGAGNFSMRFYQALSVGRIPVLVNTDMVLPLEDKINWQDAIIMEDTPEQCVEKVKAIWQRGEVEQRQRQCYEIYHEWLAHGHYLRHLSPELLAYAKSLPAAPIPWWRQLLKWK